VKFAAFFLTLTLAACSFGGAQPTATLELSTAVPASPTPLPGLVLLLAPSGSDAAQAAVAAEMAGSYAAANGLAFEQRAGLTAAELPANLSVLVILAPDPGAADLAAAAPAARIIAIGFAPAAAANITNLTASSAGESQAAFVAGYLAAISADDWRIGMLYTPAAASLVDDFTAGAEYFCGSCTPLAPPYSEYPMALQANSAGDWQAAADGLLAEYIRVVYLSPELENSGAAQYLAAYGVLLVGSGAPPADVSQNWIGSVGADPAGGLRQQLGAALSGQPSSSSSSLAVNYANPTYLSSARLSNVQTVIDDLLGGALIWQGAE
jgi:hypothetical protein